MTLAQIPEIGFFVQNSRIGVKHAYTVYADEQDSSIHLRMPSHKLYIPTASYTSRYTSRVMYIS